LKRSLKVFGNVLGNCLNDKNYLRWASRFAVPSSPTINKSETVADVPIEVHASRYRAMEEKRQLDAKRVGSDLSTNHSAAKAVGPPEKPATAAPSKVPEITNGTLEVKEEQVSESDKAKLERILKQQQKKEQFLEQQKRLEQKSCADDVTESRDENSTESDKAKLERKRKQQQKKEEFLNQMKRLKSDDQITSDQPNLVKSEPVSPIPEGKKRNFKNDERFPRNNLFCCNADDTETWMRCLDADTFKLVAEEEWDLTSPKKQPPATILNAGDNKTNGNRTNVGNVKSNVAQQPPKQPQQPPRNTGSSYARK
jgi:recombination DNA repair RAD52 pathway protein